MHSVDQDYVAFESARLLGHFISMDLSGADRVATLERKPLGDPSTKFLVRVKVRPHYTLWF